MAKITQKDIEIILRENQAIPIEQIPIEGDLLRMTSIDAQNHTYIGYALYMGTCEGFYVVATVSDEPKLCALRSLPDFQRVKGNTLGRKGGTPIETFENLFKKHLMEIYANQSSLEEAVKYGFEAKYSFQAQLFNYSRLYFLDREEKQDKRIFEIKYRLREGKIEVWINSGFVDNVTDISGKAVFPNITKAKTYVDTLLPDKTLMDLALNTGCSEAVHSSGGRL